MWPLSKTRILSMWSNVESLCAMISTVLSCISFCRDFCIRVSVYPSSELVASSNINMEAFLRKARAITILCLDLNTKV